MVRNAAEVSVDRGTKLFTVKTGTSEYVSFWHGPSTACLRNPLPRDNLRPVEKLDPSLRLPKPRRPPIATSYRYNSYLCSHYMDARQISPTVLIQRRCGEVSTKRKPSETVFL